MHKKFHGVCFEASLEAISIDVITAFEHENSIALPADYRTFLVEVGGGTPTPRNVFLDGDLKWSDVEDSEAGDWENTEEGGQLSEVESEIIDGSLLQRELKKGRFAA